MVHSDSHILLFILLNTVHPHCIRVHLPYSMWQIDGVSLLRTDYKRPWLPPSILNFSVSLSTCLSLLPFLPPASFYYYSHGTQRAYKEAIQVAYGGAMWETEDSSKQPVRNWGLPKPCMWELRSRFSSSSWVLKWLQPQVITWFQFHEV